MKTPTLTVSTQRHDPATRRRLGITYTPDWIVTEMVAWAKQHGNPVRIVDAGAGTGAFTLAAAEAFPQAQVIAVEVDPKNARVLGKRVAASPHASRITVWQRDFLWIAELPVVPGATLFIGNPPYVRHHLVSAAKKRLYVNLARELGVSENTKAGLHLHFFLRTRKLARSGDYGIFIAAAEWMHADYGGALRRLLTNGMGGLSVDTFASHHAAFPDAQTTAAVVCFEVGTRTDAIAFSEIRDRSSFSVGQGIKHPIAKLDAARHWGAFAREVPPATALVDAIPLSALFRVRRGQVTGAKDIWVHSPGAPRLPEELLVPCVTRAKEIVSAGGELRDASLLKRVVNLPADFRSLSTDAREAAKVFREWARRRGGDASHVAKTRRRWWAVDLYEPAPILCTYMGRRPPVFALNTAGVRQLNIAHGLYPLVPMSTEQLREVVSWLNDNGSQFSGRHYADTLVKFEPRDIGEIMVPTELAGQAVATELPTATFKIAVPL